MEKEEKPQTARLPQSEETMERTLHTPAADTLSFSERLEERARNGAWKTLSDTVQTQWIFPLILFFIHKIRLEPENIMTEFISSLESSPVVSCFLSFFVAFNCKRCAALLKCHCSC